MTDPELKEVENVRRGAIAQLRAANRLLGRAPDDDTIDAIEGSPMCPKCSAASIVVECNGGPNRGRRWHCFACNP